MSFVSGKFQRPANLRHLPEKTRRRPRKPKRRFLLFQFHISDIWSEANVCLILLSYVYLSIQIESFGIQWLALFLFPSPVKIIYIPLCILRRDHIIALHCKPLEMEYILDLATFLRLNWNVNFSGFYLEKKISGHLNIAIPKLHCYC